MHRFCFYVITVPAIMLGLSFAAPAFANEVSAQTLAKVAGAEYQMATFAANAALPRSVYSKPRFKRAPVMDADAPRPARLMPGGQPARVHAPTEDVVAKYAY